MIDKQSGVLSSNNTKVSDLILYLQQHKEFYGDTDVFFEIDTADVDRVEFRSYKDAINVTLCIYESD